jgi:hypothetical protein
MKRRSHNSVMTGRFGARARGSRRASYGMAPYRVGRDSAGSGVGDWMKDHWFLTFLLASSAIATVGGIVASAVMGAGAGASTQGPSPSSGPPRPLPLRNQTLFVNASRGQITELGQEGPPNLGGPVPSGGRVLTREPRLQVQVFIPDPAKGTFTAVVIDPRFEDLQGLGGEFVPSDIVA